MSKPQNPPKPPAKRETNSVTRTTAVSAYFEGPLPVPSILEGYERIVPGAAERIIAMAEADAKHQRDITNAALNAEEGSVRRGQWFAFIVAVLALSISGGAAYMGQTEVASVIGGTTVVGLVSAFILGRRGPSGDSTPKKG